MFKQLIILVISRDRKDESVLKARLVLAVNRIASLDNL